MKKIDDLWLCNSSMVFDGMIIPTSLSVEEINIRKNSKLRHIGKSMLWRIYHLRRALLGSDLTGRYIGRWIKRYCDDGNMLLDVGCGNMRLQRYMPENAFYYGLDISLDGWNLRRIGKIENATFAAASATDIPLSDGVIDIVICATVLYSIPDYKQVIAEIHRVLKPDGLILINLSNGFCHKYQVKGPHPEHCNSWTYEDFLRIMKKHGFDLIEGFMIGKWIKLPPWLTHKNLQLPYSSVKEFHNTNFLFVFRCCK